MSALTTHIRVLRAEAKALRLEAERLDKSEAADCQSFMATRVMLLSLAISKHAAADQLEASEPRLREDEHPITYDPKGKR